MNKKNLWFLTLFSLVIVLSIYYVTMPADLLAASTNSKKSTQKEKVTLEVDEKDSIAALKIEDTSKTDDMLNELQEKLTDTKTTSEEKNKVYEQIKTINTNSGLEETLEKKIKEKFSCETFAKVEETSVKIVVDKCENSKKLANNIMRLVQEEFDNKMYVSVQFSS